MAATGDPSTFDFQIDCTVGRVRTLPQSTKVLYAIDIVDNISEGSHIETATVDPVGGTGSAFLSGATGDTGQTGETGDGE